MRPAQDPRRNPSVSVHARPFCGERPTPGARAKGISPASGALAGQAPRDPRRSRRMQIVGNSATRARRRLKVCGGACLPEGDQHAGKAGVQRRSRPVVVWPGWRPRSHARAFRTPLCWHRTRRPRRLPGGGPRRPVTGRFDPDCAESLTLRSCSSRGDVARRRRIDTCGVESKRASRTRPGGGR